MNIQHLSLSVSSVQVRTPEEEPTAFVLPQAPTARQAGGSEAPTVLAQQPLVQIAPFPNDQASGPTPMPDAYVIGVTQGPLTNAILGAMHAEILAGLKVGPGGAAFLTLPADGGTPSAFVAQPVQAFTCGAVGGTPLRCSVGLVATMRPNEGSSLTNPDLTVEGGVGATMSATINGMTVLGFANIRSSDGASEELLEQFATGELSSFPPGTYSVNFGVAASAIQPMQVGMRELGRALSAVPHPKAAAASAALSGGANLLLGLNQFVDIKVGAGWRLSLQVDEEGNMTFRKGNQVVDIGELMKSIVSPATLPEIPMIDNPDNDPAVANLNITSGLINGANPLELARSMGGETHGNSVMELASKIDRYIQEVAMPVAYMLPPEIQSLIANGITDPDDFGRIYDAVNPLYEIPGGNVDRDFDLANPYGIDFGSERLRNRNAAHMLGLDMGPNALTPEQMMDMGLLPPDYLFVREVFQGGFSNPDASR